MTEVEIGKRRPWLTYVYAAGAVLMVGAVYLALANAHRDELRVVQEGSEVRVEQGRYAPLGWETYRPTEAFKPIVVESDIVVRTGECADLADCEDRMFAAVVEQARRYLRRRERLQEASLLIAQAVKLSAASNRDRLLEIQGDEQYVLGLLKLDDAQVTLTEARESFFRARAMETDAFGDSGEMVRRLDALILELDALQTASKGAKPAPPPLPAPRPAPPEPEKAPELPVPTPAVEPDAGLEL